MEIVSSEIVQTPIEQLHPHEFKDADGVNRQLFTFITRAGKEVQAVFYAKEDLPFNKNILEGKEGFIIGAPPKFRAEEEWQNFVHDVRDASAHKHWPLNIDGFQRREAVQNNKATFFVENSPEAIIDFATILGLQDKRWGGMRRLAAVERRYTPEVLELIDGIIAANHIDDKGEVRIRRGQEGEALAVLALLGDKQAEAIIRQKRLMMEERDKIHQQKQRHQYEEEYRKLEARGIKPRANITIFHATRFRPKITEDGIEITSTFDATHGRRTALSVHWHPDAVVDPHAMGSWDDAVYVIKSDLRAVFDVNRDNAILRTISPHDIYFTVSPGTRLFVPNGTLIRPGALPEGILREKRGREIIYKAGDLSAGDLEQLLSTYWNYRGLESDRLIVMERVKSLITNELWRKLSTQEKEGPAGKQYLDFQKGIDVENFFMICRRSSIKIAIEQTLKTYPLSYQVGDVNVIARHVNNWFVTCLRNNSMLPSPQMLGFKDNEGMAMLAYKLGARFDPTTEAHFNEGWAGMGGENIYWIFRELKRHKEEHSEAHDIDNCYDHNYITSYRNQFEIIKVDDRVKIMETVRKARDAVTQYLNYDLNERRGDFLSGVL